MKEVKLLKNRKGLMEEDTTTLFGEGVAECVWN